MPSEDVLAALGTIQLNVQGHCMAKLDGYALRRATLGCGKLSSSIGSNYTKIIEMTCDKCTSVEGVLYRSIACTEPFGPQNGK